MSENIHPALGVQTRVIVCCLNHRHGKQGVCESVHTCVTKIHRVSLRWLPICICGHNGRESAIRGCFKNNISYTLYTPDNYYIRMWYTRFHLYGFRIDGFPGYMVNDFWTIMCFDISKYFGNMVISAIWPNFGGQNRSQYIRNRVYFKI